ncbi:glutamate-5-semialdehyde dehydrogenase [Corynebacterium suicordis]|uniref:Gamma-glutamyl phosphate reductase n=1 Tax=Corynebacterium suicordis DSM 45110 TaxID=1121369 RepID=A0ABR9ZKI9_9CORY|nr:glutamate-5-semialdehyde dehydrogenase [Corynebacterium suicordis]MBF4553948.1 glutamate-5-semialdehyde dehydrogenase [Corynebacterium suicordis DSM 45110]MDR6277075.1 glutamate-5-semialdehyde dehydrogenase [Corynebacterium suicordis]
MTDQSTKTATELSPERQAERDDVLTKARKAKAVSQHTMLSTQQKNDLLQDSADALEANVPAILAANEKDLEAGRENGFNDSLLDRLALDEERIKGIADGLRQVVGLPDPVGEIVRGFNRPNGLRMKQVRVPLGVMGMVYEARPNVTVDAFGLAIKSGNVPLLRGSKSARYTNEKLVETLQDVAEKHGLSRDIVQLLPCETRESVQDLITARGLVDLVIPRGGAGLINAVVLGATVPAIETGTGNCHFYVDGSADVDEAIKLVINGKTRRCSVCNATEVVLLDSALSDEDKKRVLVALQEAGVTIHGNKSELDSLVDDVVQAEESDWTDEYLSFDITAAIVDGVEGAVEHITKYSSGHTEAISAKDASVLNYFETNVDSAALSINTSTAWTDGEMFGFGAEIGISTQKLHARGPMALPELTSTKWVISGDGHVRA